MSEIGAVGNGMRPQDMAAMREMMFKKADEDGNGELSEDELKTMLEQGPRPKDGASPPEGMPSISELMSQLDTDGSGGLDATEMEGMKDLMPKPPGGMEREMTAGHLEAADFMDGTSKNLIDLLEEADIDHENALAQYKLNAGDFSINEENVSLDWSI